MLHKSFELLETKALDGDGDKPGAFEAIFAVFGNVDRQGDRIAETAFDETLAAWRAKGDPIPIILSHDHKNAWAMIGLADPSDVVPIPGRGVKVKGVLDIDVNPLAAQTHRLMRRRLLKEFSFGYRVPPGGEKRAKDGAMDIVKLDLIELGPTLSGANPDTELLAVKSELEAQAERDESSAIERVVAELGELREDVNGLKAAMKDAGGLNLDEVDDETAGPEVDAALEAAAALKDDKEKADENLSDELLRRRLADMARRIPPEADTE